jgi:hypothetical protein
VTSLLLLLAAGAVMAADEADPHRPPCTSASCQKIKSFLKAKYCGESPAGNGPDDGCDIRVAVRQNKSVKVSADFECKWDEKTEKSECTQHGEPSSELRDLLVHEMHRLGLPAVDDRHLFFTVWNPNGSAWSLAEANYREVAGSDLSLCQVIIIFDSSSLGHVVKEVPFQKTDSDVPTVTTWFPIDLADADGDGRLDVILEGDAYENHWFEVDSIRDGSVHTIFSGLGYYL